MKHGSKGEDVRELKMLLNIVGDFNLDETNENFFDSTEDAVKAYQKRKGLLDDGWAGSKTMSALRKDTEDVIGKPKVVPMTSGKAEEVWLDEGKKHSGKKETHSVFNKFLSAYWAIVGLSGYKTIAGSKYAWCGLFVAAMLSITGYQYQKNGAGAKNWAKFGVAIDWKKDGIPRGAIIHINHKFKCDSGSGNHVAFADGDCTSEDLLKKNATINLFGGNQSDTAKVSTYSVKEVCAVRWPEKTKEGKVIPFPKKVTKSVNCTYGKTGTESTR